MFIIYKNQQLNLMEWGYQTTKSYLLNSENLNLKKKIELIHKYSYTKIIFII